MYVSNSLGVVVYSFDYWHKKQSGGRGEYARVIGTVEVGGGGFSGKHG